MFNVGDIVKVRSDVHEAGFVSSMDKYRGNCYKVKEILYSDVYIWEGCDDDGFDWRFRELWLEPIVEDNFEIDEKEIEKLFT